MRVSVVMATYNGEAYIYEQLRSIYEQTRKADEVIICDDCSTDRTPEIIRDFIKENALSSWSITVNGKNKGWQRNFLEALEKSSGDYVFFSDQDDIWLKDKVEMMTGLMEQNPNIQCLAGKMVTVDRDGKIFDGKNSFSAGNHTGKLTEHKFSEAFNTITLLGCVMCITRRVADIAVKMKVNEYGHDAQCCRLGVLLDGAYTLDWPVIQYRLHGGNTSGVVSGVSFGSSSLEKRKNDIKKNIVWLKRLLELSKADGFLAEEKKRMVIHAIEFQKKRAKFLDRKSLTLFLRLFRDRKFYSGLSMYVGDFAYAFHVNQVFGQVFWKISNKKGGTDG